MKKNVCPKLKLKITISAQASYANKEFANKISEYQTQPKIYLHFLCTF